MRKRHEPNFYRIDDSKDNGRVILEEINSAIRSSDNKSKSRYWVGISSYTNLVSLCVFDFEDFSLEVFNYGTEDYSKVIQYLGENSNLITNIDDNGRLCGYINRDIITSKFKLKLKKDGSLFLDYLGDKYDIWKYKVGKTDPVYILFVNGDMVDFTEDAYNFGFDADSHGLYLHCNTSIYKFSTIPLIHMLSDTFRFTRTGSLCADSLIRYKEICSGGLHKKNLNITKLLKSIEKRGYLKLSNLEDYFLYCVKNNCKDEIISLEKAFPIVQTDDFKGKVIKGHFLKG